MVAYIRDRQFGDGQTCSVHNTKSKYVNWIFNIDVPVNSCFYTDSCLEEAKNDKHKRKIAWLIEPKIVSPGSYKWIENNNRIFDFVLTYDKDLLQRGENFIWYPHGMAWTNPSSMMKSKNISAIFSNKCFTPGHKLRHDIANNFKSEIDIFGRSYNPVVSKNEALDEYMFSVTVENSIQPGYWTEKIIDCFITKTVPIYWGDDDVLQKFNPCGIIKFKDVEHLSYTLNNLKQIEYTTTYNNKYISILDNYNMALQYQIPEDWIFTNYPFLFT
jgi:hypothetical protein